MIGMSEEHLKFITKKLTATHILQVGIIRDRYHSKDLNDDLLPTLMGRLMAET